MSSRHQVPAAAAAAALAEDDMVLIANYEGNNDGIRDDWTLVNQDSKDGTTHQDSNNGTKDDDSISANHHTTEEDSEVELLRKENLVLREENRSLQARCNRAEFKLAVFLSE